MSEVTDREDKALTTIEIAERLAVKAHTSITEGRPNEALAYLEALIDATSIRTATAVREQSLSDRIAHDAINHVQIVALKIRSAKIAEGPVQP